MNALFHFKKGDVVLFWDRPVVVLTDPRQHGRSQWGRRYAAFDGLISDGRVLKFSVLASGLQRIPW